jgi:hypothetical protein
MVAKIMIGTSIRGILHYNENKVTEGEAKLILASGFATEAEHMSFNNKLMRFEHLTELKPSIKTNALHITLNFDASEQIDNVKMQQIALAYLERIGFGEQPFLVYRHNDVAHQHLHIATTSIQRDGTAIDLHNIGRDLSEPARKAIEKEFNLVVAESKAYKPQPVIKPADAEKANYGRIPTKKAISNVIVAVMNTYKFTSLAEYNAVLKQFNVIVDRGKDDTEMFRKKGLIYFLLDKQGNKTGVPIKASAFYSKPTLRNLEKKFEKNIEKRKPYKSNLTGRIDKIFNRYNSITKSTLIVELQKSGISLVFRQNEQGFIYGTTFIDHINKSVFNGSDLDKAHHIKTYSAKALTERFGNTDQIKTYLKPVQEQKRHLKQDTTKHTKSYLKPVAPTNYLKDLTGKSQPDYAPVVQRKKKKRKKRLTI